MPHALSEGRISEEAYLEGELNSDIRHEYIDGLIYAMSGARVNHSRISGNLYRKFGNHLDNSPCEPFTSDMKVRIASRFFYPDVLVDCSDNDGEATFTETPVIIVEVLSRSTRKLDKTIKMNSYLQIPTLQEYILIEQAFVELEVVRKRDNHWQRPEHYYLGDKVAFESIGLMLSVEEIYERVDNDDMKEWREKPVR